MKHTIKDLFGNTIFKDDCETIKECVLKAIAAKKSLSYAYLRYANLRSADLRSADLRYANLRYADLSYADLSSADLCYADLRSANLYSADLRSADLCYAELRSANLRSADLRYADLRSANLRSADLRYADLRYANLRYAKNSDLAIAMTRILPEGELVGWKKCQENIIVKLKIPHESKRSSAFGRKCRCEYAEVLEVFGADEGVSQYEDAEKVHYRKGETVKCDNWSEEWTDECAGGIHFFITRLEAENY